MVRACRITRIFCSLLIQSLDKSKFFFWQKALLAFRLVFIVKKMNSQMKRDDGEMSLLRGRQYLLWRPAVEQRRDATNLYAALSLNFTSNRSRSQSLSPQTNKKVHGAEKLVTWEKRKREQTAACLWNPLRWNNGGRDANQSYKTTITQSERIDTGGLRTITIRYLSRGETYYLPNSLRTINPACMQNLLSESIFLLRISNIFCF